MWHSKGRRAAVSKNSFQIYLPAYLGHEAKTTSFEVNPCTSPVLPNALRDFKLLKVAIGSQRYHGV
jgi:hypothetical protein